MIFCGFCQNCSHKKGLRRLFLTIIGFLGVVNGYSDKRIGASVEEKPLSAEGYESFGEDGTGGVLSALLEGVLGVEVGVVEAVEQAGRVVGGEEGLPGTIGSGGIVWVAVVASAVLSVVEEDDAFAGLDGRRSAFHELAVEVASAGVHDVQQRAVGGQHGCPVYQVGACGDVDEVFAPVHEVFPFDASDDLAAVLHLGHDGTRLGVAFAQLAFVGIGEDGTVFRPMDEVARCGDAKPGKLVVPTCVGHYVKAVFGHADTRVFASSGHVEVGPFVVTREEDGGAMMLEVDAVLAESIADARGAGADAFGDVVLGAIEEGDAAVEHGSGRVERLAVLPLSHFAVHRAEEATRRVGADDRVDTSRPLEAEPSPFLLSIRHFLCLQGKQQSE